MDHLSSEGRELLELFAARSHEHVLELNRELSTKIESSRLETKLEVNQAEARLSTQINDVKIEQRKQRDGLESHALSLAHLETQVGMNGIKLNKVEERIDSVELESRGQGRKLAYIGGVLLAGGGAIGAAVAKVLGH